MLVVVLFVVVLYWQLILEHVIFPCRAAALDDEMMWVRTWRRLSAGRVQEDTEHRRAPQPLDAVHQAVGAAVQPMVEQMEYGQAAIRTTLFNRDEVPVWILPGAKTMLSVGMEFALEKKQQQAPCPRCS